MEYFDKIKETTKFILDSTNFKPEIGIILGSGLGGLTKKIDIKHILEYEKIPHFPVSTVEGHSGRLILGTLGGKNVIAMQGRFHFYEGYDMKEVTFPVRVMNEMGIKHLFVSNASGGVNASFAIGDLMIIRDHINLIPNPLLGRNDERLGTRFPDMSKAYNPELVKLAESVGKQNNIDLKKGVYVGVTGPTFETPAEYKYFNIIGGDTVGMSTTPEVIVASHGKMSVFGISIITDLGVEGKIVEVSHEDVQKEAQKAELKMTVLIEEMLKQL